LAVEILFTFFLNSSSMFAFSFTADSLLYYFSVYTCNNFAV